jgi:hypothetical protein
MNQIDKFQELKVKIENQIEKIKNSKEDPEHQHSLEDDLLEIMESAKIKYREEAMKLLTNF